MQSSGEADVIRMVILFLVTVVTTVSAQGPTTIGPPSSTAGPPTTAGPPSATTLPGTSCPIVFVNVSPGRRSLGATPINGVNDRTLCETMCRNDPACFAYQIDNNPGDPYCWHQKTQSALNDLYDDSLIAEYVKQFNCGGPSGTDCTIIFPNLSPGRRSLGATPITGVTDRTVCETMCRNDLTCFAYQIDNNPGDPYCWHQRTQTALNDLYDDSLIAEYVKQLSCGSSSLPSSASSVASSSGIPSSASSLPGTNCPIVFNNVSPGRRSLGATPITGVNDRTVCETMCRNDPACFAYQLDRYVGEAYCWHQRTQNALNDLYDDSMIDEYVKQCASSSSSVSATTSSSGVQSSTTSSGTNCPIVFNNVSPGRRSLGATPITAVTDRTVCETMCRNDPACFAYQLDRYPGEAYCWHQRTQNALNDLYDDPMIDEYVKQCQTSSSSSSASTTLPTTVPTGPSCVAFTNVYPGLQSIFAIPIPLVTTTSACEAGCRSDPTCYSYQINVNLGQTYCWYQRDQSQLTDPNLFAGQPGVTEYIKTGCSSSSSTTLQTSTLTQGPICVAFTNVYPGLQSIFAIAIPGVTTIPACEAGCRSDPTCYSYQINVNSGETYCWYQRDQSRLSNSDQFAGQPGVTEYIKTSCSSSTTALPTSSASQVSTTTAMPTSSASQGPICVTFTNVYPGLQSLFARPIAGVTTTPACEAGCRSEPTCYSYQINVNSGETYCWYQRDQGQLSNSDQFGGQPGVTEYIKTGCTSSTFTTTLPTSTPSVPSLGPNCVVIFANLYPGFQSVFAESIPGVTDAATCEARCRVDPGCFSYQINTISQQFCWNQRNPSELDPNLMATQPNVTEFIKTNNCTSLPSTSTVTTLSTTRTTLPSSTTPGPNNCVTAYFNLYPGQRSGDATPITDALTSAACQSRCSSDPTCLAYQLNPNQPTETLCWIQRSQDNLRPDQLYTDRPDIAEFVKLNNCSGTFPGSSSTASTTTLPSTSTSIPSSSATTISASSASTSTSVPSTSATLGPNCVYVFLLLYPGNSTLGADPIQDVGNAGDCESRCRNDPRCVSYQLDRTPGALTFCWIQRDPNAQLWDRPFIEEYFKLNNCTATISTRTSTSGPTPTPTSLTSTPSTTSVPSVSTRTSTTTIRSSSAPTTRVCDYNFAPIYNKNMPGGTQTRWTTLDECQRACLDNLQCIGVDVNSNPGQIYCYLIFTVMPLSDYPGVTHFDITRGANCPQPSSTTTVSTPTPTTTGPPVCVYKLLEGANADGGNPVATGVSEDQCVTLCNVNALCKSMEYATASKTCYIHVADDYSQSATCCNRYILTCSSSPCTDDFLEQKGYGPANLQGYVQTGITTLDACKQRCLSISSCTRFFMIQNPRDPQSRCYLYYNAYDAVGQAAGVDLYIRQRCLYNTSVTVLTTTTTPDPTPPPNSCLIDLAFVVDSSGSIRDNSYAGVDNWQLVKIFLKDIVNGSAFHYGKYFDHVAIVEFSDFASIYTDFTQSSTMSQSQMLTLIDNMPYLGSETNTPAGLRLGRSLFEDPARGSRPNAVHMMILLTDGRTTSRWLGDLNPELMALNNSAANIVRYAIGVTSNASMEELQSIALFQNAIEVVNTYEGLQDVVAKAEQFIETAICQSSARPTALSTTQRTSAPTAASTISTTTQTTPTSTSTTTRTSTSTSTSTSTTTPTTTTFIPSTVLPYGYEGVFGVYKNSTEQGPKNSTDFIGALANRYDRFSLTTDRFNPYVKANAFFYTEICAGILASTVCQLRTTGAYPVLSFDWNSTGQNDIDSGCRGGILSMALGVTTGLSQIYQNGGVYSDTRRLTTWSMFSIADTMRYNTSLLSVYASTSSSSYGPLPFMSPYVNPQTPDSLYNAATKEYSCLPQTSAYFFSMSVGVAGGTTASVQLKVGDRTFEMLRMSTTTTGTTTLARSILAPCNSATALMTLTSGSVIPGTNLISFTAFPYSRNTSYTSVAWAGYRSSNITISDTVTYDLWLVQLGVTQNSNTIRIPNSGYYYVYISSGIQRGSTVDLRLIRNSELLFGLTRQATNHNGEDMIGHGVVVILYSGDIVKVQSLSGGYSNPTGLHASFFGMLLYDL